MKPAWDTLIAEYKDSSTILVADVDCTGAGQSLCQEVGVRGYPTIKYGDPDNLKDYKEGRTLKDLQAFAAKLGPICGPQHPDHCDDAQKSQIAEFSALGAEKREAMMKEKNDEIDRLEAAFKADADAINKQYSEASEKKDAEVKAIKQSGFGMLRAVAAYKKQQGEL